MPQICPIKKNCVRSVKENNRHPFLQFCQDEDNFVEFFNIEKQRGVQNIFFFNVETEMKSILHYGMKMKRVTKEKERKIIC